MPHREIASAYRWVIGVLLAMVTAEKGPVPANLLAKRQALRDLPAKVEADIAGMDAEALEAYASR